MAAISPGVYTKIIALESYVEEVPSSTAFVAIISDKGEDNVLKLSLSREDFLSETGKPNVIRYGRWAHGSLIAERFMAASPSLYYIRVLPEDAVYANQLISATFTPFVDFTSGPCTDQPPIFEPVYSSYKKYTSKLISIDNFPLIKNYFVTFNHNGTNYTFKIFKDNLTLVRKGGQAEKSIYISDGSAVYTLGVQTDPLGTPVPGETFKVKLIATPASGCSGTIPSKIYVTDITKTNVFSLSVVSGNIQYTLIQPSNYEETFGEPFSIARPLFVIRGKGRGRYYNRYNIKFNLVENLEDVVALTIEEIQDSGEVYQIGQYYISFDKNKVDESGESMFIKHVIDNYARDIRIEIDEDSLEETKGDFIDFIVNLTNSKIEINEYKDSDIPGFYIVDAIAEEIPDDLVAGKFVFLNELSHQKMLVGGNVQTIGPGTIVRKTNDPLAPEIMENIPRWSIVRIRDSRDVYYHIGSGKLIRFDPYLCSVIKLGEVTLENGSDGSLYNEDIKAVNQNVAVQLLSNAYAGNIDPNVLNTEFHWIDIVFCGGYPLDVVNKAYELAKIRDDCMVFVDLGNNPDPQTALNKRIESYYFNDYRLAIYEPYTKIREPFSGLDIWVSPIYFLAYLMGINDRINEVWYAVAGLTRGMATGIKELRYNLITLSERDQFYLNQINPIIHFREGKAIYGQLTSQRKANALQDINIVRCILYIKRALQQYCKYFIFDFNDPFTWMEIEKGVNKFLEDVKSRRGLYDYKVSVGADDYLKKRKAAKVDVILEPTRVLEKIYLSFFVK